ncbi:hypothetical protein MKW92_040227 [Papaver armeniacum]|nr:hypothetical protein MKW92_040227 [Papaver armeniacum]
MNRYGLLEESQNKLYYVLALTVENLLEHRLQTLVFKSGMAKSIHHARVLIRQRHIRNLCALVCDCGQQEIDVVFNCNTSPLDGVCWTYNYHHTKASHSICWT